MSEPIRPGVGMGTSSVRLHRLLLAAAVVVPGLLFAGAAWQNHGDVLREGGDSVVRTAAVMQEHARKVFETAELAIGQVDERINDVDAWSVAGVGTSRFLFRLNESMDQVTSVSVADADGNVVASSLAVTGTAGEMSALPGSVAEAEFFRVQRDRDRGTYVGSVHDAGGALPYFPIVRRRTAADGRFVGTIHVAASPGYFARFYADAAPPVEHVALLLRDDGAILARDPPNAALRQIPASSPLLRRIVTREDDGQLLFDLGADGVSRTYAVRRVVGYPVSVVFAVPQPVMLWRWYRNLRIYGGVAGVTAVTLLAVSWLALRRARAEQLALAWLRAESAQRKAAEAQLRHAQRMDAVGQLTGGVAHDFNNLLTAILGNLELIQRSVERPDAAPRILRLAATATKAVERGSALTRSLLAFSRKQPMHPTAIDANALVAEFLDLVEQAVGVAIAVRFDPAPDLPHCLADPAELQSALLNLAINARDAMPGGGHLVLSTGVETLGAAVLSGNQEARPGRFVSIAVADDGTGMPPEVVAKAFEPFFTTKPIGQGTGLGLSQVFGFVRQLNGHVTLGTPAGGGTVVTLFLPVLDGAAPGHDAGAYMGETA